MNKSEISDWMTKYHERRSRERDEAVKRVSDVCSELMKMNVAEVRMSYDGYGDSGRVEGVIATREGEDDAIELPTDVRDQLIAAAETLLPDGWENNEGAFGELALDVRNRSLTREHNWRVESTEYDEEVWQI
jgi:hypothetical protein